MSSGQIITIKLSRGDGASWGFRLQGGKDFGFPLSVAKVNPGSLSDNGGLHVGDVVLKIGGQNVDFLRHKEAQDAILRAGNYLELQVQRGGFQTWKPSVSIVGELPTPSSNLISEPTPLIRTSLKHKQQDSRPIGSGHNVSATPFGSKQLVHLQYNSPANLYSMQNIAET